jgi:hypothetical protein
MRFLSIFAALGMALAASAQTQKEYVIRTKDATGTVTQNVDFTGTFKVGGTTITSASFTDITDGQTFTGRIDFSGTDHSGLRFISLTTTQRDLLTAAAGDTVYNTNDTELQTYTGAWQRIIVLPTATTPAQGDILYYTGSAWAALPAGTSGDYLETQGAGANPQWSSPSGAGDMTKATYDADLDNLIDVAAGGTGAASASAARTNLGVAIGTDVQAYHATLSAVAGGTYTGATSITTLGTVATGTWQGTAIDATYIGAHASSHVDGGGDAIDGDTLEITWAPSNYTRSTGPAEVDTADDLTAHLSGIDTQLGTLDSGKASTSHAATHIDGGSDVIDGDKIEITATWNNITPDAGIAEADSVDDLAAILEGIDDALAAFGGFNLDQDVTSGAAPTFTGTNFTGIPTAGLSTRSGSDGTVVTGTAGTSGNLVQWDANGDAVDASIVAANVKTTRTGIWRNAWLSAAGWRPDTTTGPEETNQDEHDVRAFDGATSETARYQLAMPYTWDAGTIKVEFYWLAATGASASDGVAWEISGASVANDEVWPPTTGTAIQTTDTVSAVGDLHVAKSASITITGAAAGELVELELFRDHDDAGDTMTEDALLLGVLLWYQESSTEPSAP